MPQYQEKLFGPTMTNSDLSWQILRAAFTEGGNITNIFEAAEEYATKNEFQKRDLVEKVLPLYKAALDKASSFNRVRFVTFLIPCGEYDLSKGEQQCWDVYQPPGIHFNSGEIPKVLKIPVEKVMRVRSTTNLRFACAVIYSARRANLGFKTGQIELDVEEAELHLLMVNTLTGQIIEDNIFEKVKHNLLSQNVTTAAATQGDETPESLKVEIERLLDEIVTKVKAGEFPSSEAGDVRHPDFPALKNWFEDRVFLSPEEQATLFESVGAGRSAYNYSTFAREAAKDRDRAIVERNIWWRAARAMERVVTITEDTEELKRNFHHSTKLRQAGNEPVGFELGACMSSKLRVYRVFVAEKETLKGGYLGMYWANLDGRWKCVPQIGYLRPIPSLPKTRF